MKEQYDRFFQLKLTCTLETMTYYQWAELDARQQWMDAESFVISFRRRGYEHALQEAYAERPVIDEEYLNRLPIGETIPLIDERPPVVKRPASTWSSVRSR